MISGVVNLYKEIGFTSVDALRVLGGIVGERKMGHTGTLDPEAEGVLPVCLGKATKAAELITGTDKEYICSLAFGSETTTQDASGEITNQTEYSYDEAFARGTILSFQGGYDQVPPMYSALKHEGKKLYDLARKGIEVDRKPRPVRIDEIEILSLDEKGAKIRVACSKGTYIRSLCEDIGRKTGYLAHMTSLVRTKCGPYTIEKSLKLSQVEARVKAGEKDFIEDLSSLFSDLPAFRVKEEEDLMLMNGNYLTYGKSYLKAVCGRDLTIGDQVRMELSTGELAGLYTVSQQFSADSSQARKRQIKDDALRLVAFKMFV
ncbi:MAG: tRNA pseudouridine(55) synthase TruB [Firmicutes bacterium]|nr:tRNA pseudouridine(55) synthase TruB [Bacillota bacterium]